MAHLLPFKAPGLDELPLEFHNQFREVLAPKLKDLYAHIYDSATLPATVKEALIVVIPKPVKRPFTP